MSTLRIIRNFQQGIDTTDEVSTLPKTVISDIKNNKYELENDILTWRNKSNKKLIVLPPEHIKALLQYTHNNGTNACHQGSKDMISKITPLYYWHGFNKDIIEYCKHCDTY